VAAGADVAIETVGQWGGCTYAVATDGNLVYMGVGPRLVVLDVSNPAQPVKVGQSPVLPHEVADIAIAGRYAYLATFYGGLQVVDISDPCAPAWVGGHDTTGDYVAVAVDGDYAYVVDWYDGLHIFDVSQPTAPVRVGRYAADSTVWAVAVVGGYVYLPIGHREIRILDVSHPAEPVWITSSYWS
jgi:hypothetical protein